MSLSKTRHIMRFEDWPVVHRRAWQAATDAGDVFSAQGLAARWTPKTCRQIVKDYGMWLQHLRRQSLPPTLGSTPAPLERETLRAFVEGLQSRLAPMSVCSRLRGLSEAYRVMWPSIDLSILRRMLSRLKRNAAPSRNKTAALLSSREILHAALRHLKSVTESTAPSDTIHACWGRNALMVAILAVHPIRLANLTMIRLGLHLHQDGDTIWLRFSDEETKERRSMELPLADILREPLKVYLELYRPVLLGSKDSNALWISTRKGPMKEQSVYEQVVRTTETLFGHPINPHLFRDCAMTTLATEDPAHVRVGARLLGHSSLRTGERHYNQATMVSAVTQYHDTLAALRGNTPPPEDPTP
jgi:site-specific recombinase XerD